MSTIESAAAEIFESADVPEEKVNKAPLQASVLQQQNTEIVDAPVRASMAFEHFAGRVFDPTGGRAAAALRAGGASDAELLLLASSSGASGTAKVTTHESIGAGRPARFESPLERYLRLKEELHSFEKELAELAEGSKVARGAAGAGGAGTGAGALVVDDAAVSGALSRELSTMQSSLERLMANQSYRPLLEGDAALDASQLQQKLALDRVLGEIQAYGAGGKAPASVAAATSAATGAGAGAGAGAGGSAENGAVFELYYKPDAANAGARSLLDVAALDRRVTTLEKTLGSGAVTTGAGGAGGALATASVAATGIDVQTRLYHLQRKVDLLDAAKLDAVNRRVKALASEIETVEEERKKKLDLPEPPATQHVERVRAMYELMSRWDTAALQLPTVIARLQSLRELHEESAAAVIRLHELEAEKADIDRLVEGDRRALAAAQASMAKNMEIFQRNVTALEQRFTALAARIR